MIRPVALSDAQAITDIYNYYVLNSVVTFEETPVSVESIQKKIEKIAPDFPFLVIEEENIVIGYAYASEWNTRSAYRFTTESTIYLKHGFSGKGYGTLLYSELINQLKEAGYHVILGGVSMPIKESIALHEKLGYKKVAHYKELGFKFGEWIDVGFWELLVN